MKRFIQGSDRTQGILLPEQLDDYVTEENPVRVIDIFVDELDLATLGFSGVAPADTGRPAYHPADLSKIYIYGYLNRIQSSRRLEREAQRNIELMWLTGRLTPDFKTIANFRKVNGVGIRNVCRQFVLLCRNLDLFTQQLIPIDGSKFKAVNNRDRNFTRAKVQARLQQIVAHEVTNIGNDRSQLANMSEQAREATGIEKLAVVADRGYFSGEEILACDHADHRIRPQATDVRRQGRRPVR